jgi:hypothetical protein
LPAAACLVALVTMIGLGVAAAMQSVDDSAGIPVYTVATLRMRLQQNPETLLRRTVRVHAVAVQCLTWLTGPVACFDWQPALVDAGDTTMSTLSLAAGPAPPALAWLRGLPLIGRFAPQPRAIHWGISADYTIRVRAFACAAGSPPPCFQAVLQDVAL